MIWKLTRARLAKRRRGPYVRWNLTCEDCGDLATGDAAFWIAVVVAEEDRVAAYCPHCAETNFRFFSRRASRRRKLAD